MSDGDLNWMLDGDLNLLDGDLNLLCADLEINVPRMLAKSRRRRKKYSKIRSQGWSFEYVGRRLMLSDGDK